MLTFHSFLQTVFQFVKSLAVTITKKMYRYSAVLVSGTAVVTVVILTANGFGGGGRSALVAYAEPYSQDNPLEEESLSEETELITEAKVPLILTDSGSIHAYSTIALNCLKLLLCRNFNSPRYILV